MTFFLFLLVAGIRLACLATGRVIGFTFGTEFTRASFVAMQSSSLKVSTLCNIELSKVQAKTQVEMLMAAATPT
jgi:hypothetical protein